MSVNTQLEWRRRMRRKTWPANAFISMFSRMAAAFFRPALTALVAAMVLAPAHAQNIEPPMDQPVPTQTSGIEDVEPEREPLLDPADVTAWLDGYMPYALARGDIAGAVVTVVSDGEIIVNRGYGYSDLETETPVDPERTLFRPGSTSKLFTWTAVMQLVERGELDLDADINSYLDFEVPSAGRPVTLRDVMTHTPGFEEVFRNLIMADTSAAPSLSDYVRENIPGAVFPPGEVPAYSNYATALAGHIVAQVSGLSFDDYVETHIFEPLGMENSTFRQPLPERFSGQMSSAYTKASDGEAQAFEIIPAAPAGALSSTGADMGRFMIAHLDEGGPLLEPGRAEQMHTSADRHFSSLNAMMLGFYEQDRNGLSIIGHGGDTQYFHSNLHLFLDEGVGLFVSMNSSGVSGASGTIRDALFTGFTDRYFPAETEDRPTLDSAAEHGAQLAGVYEISRGAYTNFFSALSLVSQIKLEMNEDNELIVPLLTDPAGNPTRWREVEPYLWQRVGGTDLLAAEMEDGRVVSWTVEPVSPIMIFRPVPWWKSSALMLPLLGAAFGALALTVIFWPVRAIVRWRYKTRFNLEGHQAWTHRLVRLGAVGVIAHTAGWVILLSSMMSDLSMMSGGADGWIRLLQIGAILPLAALGLSVWNASEVWRGQSSWFGKLWSLVLVAAFLIVVWFDAVGNLFSFSLSY